MSQDPAPFVRGAAFPAEAAAGYPRLPADPRLPQDVARWAETPVGVRLELVGDAEALRIAFDLTDERLGIWGDGAGVTFEGRAGARLIDSVRVAPGMGEVELRLRDVAPASAEETRTVFLPSGHLPVVTGLTALKGDIAPAAAGRRWVAYGDSITAGFGASAPSRAWPALVALERGLDVINLGFPACGRGELAVAEHIATLEADVVSIAFGTNCWSMLPFDANLLREQARAFIAVASSRGRTPLAVLSQIVRPAAEDTPNAAGATQRQLRRAVEDAAWDARARGWPVELVEGADLMTAERLPDDIHPDDQGHAALARAMAPAIARLLAAWPRARRAG